MVRASWTLPILTGGNSCATMIESFGQQQWGIRPGLGLTWTHRCSPPAHMQLMCLPMPGPRKRSTGRMASSPLGPVQVPTHFFEVQGPTPKLADAAANARTEV